LLLDAVLAMMSKERMLSPSPYTLPLQGGGKEKRKGSPRGMTGRREG